MPTDQVLSDSRLTNSHSLYLALDGATQGHEDADPQWLRQWTCTACLCSPWTCSKWHGQVSARNSFSCLSISLCIFQACRHLKVNHGQYTDMVLAEICVWTCVMVRMYGTEETKMQR
jgi:hypothetical protein